MFLGSVRCVRSFLGLDNFNWAPQTERTASKAALLHRTSKRSVCCGRGKGPFLICRVCYSRVTRGGHPCYTDDEPFIWPPSRFFLCTLIPHRRHDSKIFKFDDGCEGSKQGAPVRQVLCTNSIRERLLPWIIYALNSVIVNVAGSS